AGGKRKLDDVISVLDDMSERSSLAEARGQAGGATSEPAMKRPLTFVSIPSKFKAAFAALLVQAARLEQVPYMMPTQKEALLHEGSRMLAELLKLAILDGDLDEERKFIAD
ncbi:unnamed protein product, partial [Ectocarpus sp. 12 AP-2014]